MLKVEGVYAQYGKIKVLHNISIHIEQGEMVAILGGNGAGKSTLLKVISGLVRPIEGEITFFDDRIDRMPAEKIVEARIVHIPEGRNIFAKATVLTNLEMGAFVRKNKEQVNYDIEKYLDMFPILRERKNQLAGTLSGGEQQMLAIARGLMTNPKLLIFDEPSMGLAPFLVNEIFKIIKNLHKKGISILLVEQNVKKALKITQRAYVLELGKIINEGNSEDLLKSDEIRKSYLGEN